MTYKLSRLTPMLETPDIESTIAFYTRVLGFTIQNYQPGAGWVSLTRDGVSIMFALPNQHRNLPNPIMSGSLYFNTDNVDEIWQQVKEQCLVCYPPEDLNYGMREFGIFDNNGYLLQFGQEIA